MVSDASPLHDSGEHSNPSTSWAERLTASKPRDTKSAGTGSGLTSAGGAHGRSPLGANTWGRMRYANRRYRLASPDGTIAHASARRLKKPSSLWRQVSIQPSGA